MIKLLLNLCFVFVTVNGKELSEYATLPRLFDLDDYHECMSQRNGLYCMGTFHLTPTKQNNTLYILMEEYSNNKFTFNRTLIHRGYCLSQRCPHTTSNTTLRFERCVSKWAQDKELHATIQKLDYCQNSETQRRTLDAYQLAFCIVVLVILLLNAVGTLYDMSPREKVPRKLRNVAILWSVRGNWRKLTTVYEQRDPRLAILAPMQGVRVIIAVTYVFHHSAFVYLMMYLHNPQYVEKMIAGLFGVIMANGVIVGSIYLVFSSFLCAYSLLLSSDKKPLALCSMPKYIIKRIIRTAPVHLLVVAFGAIWYAQSSDGPLRHSIIETEQNSCRTKFWAHALFINNFVDTDKKCYLQTWFLAVDMQLYIVSLFLTMFLAKVGSGILKILVTLYFISLSIITILAYFNGWEPMLYLAVPDTIYAYINSPSFERFYMWPFGFIPSCLVGLTMAHLQYTWQQDRVKVQNWKWLTYAHVLVLPVYLLWLLSGIYIRETFTSPIALAAYIGLERLLFNIMIILFSIGVINIDSPLRRVLAWRGWDVFARLSLPVMMIHWPVMMIITASRPALTHVTPLGIVADAAATWVITYALAVPVSILVETPVQRFLDHFL